MPKFSIVYPTRDRPQFVEVALRFLEESTFKDFEVIVSDNPSSLGGDCAGVCRSSKLKNLRYFRTPHDLTMVENWNLALTQTTGDYVLYLTDKMFLYPKTLERLDVATRNTDSEIVSWVDAIYDPKDYASYFSSGQVYPRVRSNWNLLWAYEYRSYSPSKALRTRARARLSRDRQNASTYSRGKIIFGAYKKTLIERVINKTGMLFHELAPDYTSMICALSLAKSAIEMRLPGVVHINTDLSNGGRMAVDDSLARSWIDATKDSNQVLADMVIPGLYASQHAFVSHDYQSILRKFSLGFPINKANWIRHCEGDLSVLQRNWSSSTVEIEQLKKLNEAIRSLSIPEKLNHHLISLRNRVFLRTPLRQFRWLFLVIKSNLKFNQSVEVGNIYDCISTQDVFRK
jgi:glycosyltransferase involved in cell wall biosynthesis